MSYNSAFDLPKKYRGAYTNAYNFEVQTAWEGKKGNKVRRRHLPCPDKAFKA